MIEAVDSIRILHVDDEPDFADIAATFLEREDDRFSVETATSVDDALEMLSTTEFDCIVSDYDMPEKNGIEFLRTVRANDSELPFLLFTGKGSEEVASDAISAGATDYIRKEPSSDQYELLANRISNAVAQHQSERTQQWLLELAENTDRVLYSFSADWEELLFVSSAYEDIWGRSLADLYEEPTDFLAGIHPDDRDRVRDAMETVTDGETVDLEYRVNAQADYTRWVRAYAEPITDETGSVLRIAGFAADITDERRRRQRHERQRESLLELATDEAVTSGDFDPAVSRITETAAAVLDVDRVNVWLEDADGTARTFKCVDNYDRRTGDHTTGAVLLAEDYPSYLEALEHNQAIDATDARADPRTAELADDYLAEHDVGALLDSGLRLGGDFVGVICHEHVGGSREWTDDEIDFASDVADIVARALRNEERRERKQELELKTRVVEEAPVGISISGPAAEDYPLVYVNEQFETLTGYDRAEALGKNCRFLQGPDTAAEPVRRIREAIDANEPVSVALRNYRKDGTEFWNRVSIAPVETEPDTVTHFVGFQQDVTDRVERESTLQELHSAAAEIQACDSVEAACEETVTAAETVLEFELCSILLHEDGYLDPVALSSDAPPDGARRMDNDEGLAGRTFQTGESYVIDEVTPDDVSDPAKASYRSGMSIPIGDHGVFQAVSTDVRGFDDADRRLVELLVAHTARTIDRLEFEAELRSRREALQRRNNRLQRFAGLVSHDLRNPLNVATGKLELAREECDSEHLDGVAGAHDRMEGLIEHLLTLAREGEPVTEPEPVELDAVARRCWQSVATTEATLTVDSAHSIRAEPERLQRLFENLMRNSVEHGSTGNRTESGDGVEHTGGSVSVTIGDLDDGFYVADDGPGIPADERGDVFEYGYSTVSDGTGFGLAIVKEIADAHDWTVSITDSDDGGARFEFTGVDRS